MSKGRSTRYIYKQGLINSIRRTGSVPCHICGRDIKRVDDLTIDHIIPRSMGGTTLFENLQPAHFRCNQQKGIKVLPTLTSPKSNVGDK